MIRANPKKHSYSRLSTFAEKCERCHAFDAFTPWKGSLASRRGTHVHDCMEAMGKLMIAGKTWDEARDEVLEKPPAGEYKLDKIRSYINRGAAVLRVLEPTATEKWFDKHSDYPLLTGKIDLISGVTPITDSMGNIVDSRPGRCILDYKTTSSSAYIKSEQEAKLSLQTLIYALIEDCPTTGYIWFLPSGKARATIVEFDERALEIASRTLIDLMRVIDDRWELALERAAQTQRLDGKEHLLVSHKGRTYDFSVFAPGVPSRPFILSKHSRHAELCLGMEKP